MTDVIKVLGQVAPSATTATTLYTVPNLAQTTISSLVVCNRSANSTQTVVIGMTLSQTDVVTVYGSDGNLTFNLFGVETT